MVYAELVRSRNNTSGMVYGGLLLDMFKLANTLTEKGKTISPTRRGAILALRYFCNPEKPPSIRQIADQLQVSKSAVHGICRHAIKTARRQRETATADLSLPTNSQEADPAWEAIIESEEPENLNSTAQVDEEGVDPPYVGEFSLLELLRASGPQKTGKRPKKLSAVDKDHLVEVVKRDWATRHMSLVDLQKYNFEGFA
ncbi:hypothetical protein HOY82DRAFT_536312 [Tuber indicum]|nr:hypothetical protein HOY82DRAFT_536312 [Tuber indicum]